MKLTIEFEVTVEPNPEGGFVARRVLPPGPTATGDTEAEAVEALRAQLAGAPFPVVQDPNPWAAMAEAFRDTPLLDEWKQELADRRRASVEAERGPT